MLMVLVEENGVIGMRPYCGGVTITATQINEIGGWATMGGGYDHREHSEAKGH